MKTIKTFVRVIGAFAFCSAQFAQAQWNQNSGTGPYTYTDPANWVGGLINNVFTTAPASGLTLQFTNDFILTNGESLYFNGNENVIFQSDGATARTLHISLGSFLRTNNTGGTITIGTVTNPLILDLYNSTRTIGGGAAGSTSSANICTNNIYAQIVDLAGGTNGIVCGGGNIYAYLLNTNNSFKGPVTFPALRGGGFANIKPIGGGPSALGAPLDASNATITVADGSSFGLLKYLGSGDSSDRPFVWNITFSNSIRSAYQFVNAGSGLLDLSGQWSLPTNSTNGAQFIINALNAPIELDGYIRGYGNVNGTFTYLLFYGGPAGVATNRITLTGPTNDFRDFMVSNVVLAYNSTSNAGVPCSLGAGTNITLGGGSGGWLGWVGGSGQGSSLQYFGPNATFTRPIQFTGNLGSSYYWALDNAGTNTALTWSNTLTWNVQTPNTGYDPRYLFINPNITATNIVLSQIPDANISVNGAPIGTVVAAANPAGYTVNNGGVVQLLNPGNTFAGGVQAAYARTIQALMLADIGQPSSIGTGQYPYTVGTPLIQLTGINLGSTDSQRGGVFSYIGTNNVSTDQAITILGSTGTLCSGTLRNDSPNNSSVHFSSTSAWNLYANMPYCQVILAGSAEATNIVDSPVTDIAGSIPGPGVTSLTVSGSIWELTAAQSYSGTTTVSSATMILHGSIFPGLGVTIQSNGILGGDGTVNENVNVQPGGTLSAGIGLGTLTITGNVTNSGNILMKVNAASGQSDHLVGMNTLAYGGTLVISNAAGTYTNGASYQLFSATNYAGTFASVNPAVPASGLAWDLTALPTTGVLKIVPGTVTGPPQFQGITRSGSDFILSASGGPLNGGCYVRYSTNIALPMQNWGYLSTNQFDGNGNLLVTNLIQPGTQQEFFRLQLQ